MSTLGQLPKASGKLDAMMPATPPKSAQKTRKASNASKPKRTNTDEDQVKEARHLIGQLDEARQRLATFADWLEMKSPPRSSEDLAAERALKDVLPLEYWWYARPDGLAYLSVERAEFYIANFIKKFGTPNLQADMARLKGRRKGATK